MKFAIFLKSSLFLTVSIVFSVFKQNFTTQQLKETRTTMNAKISVLVTCVEVIIYLLLDNLHDSTFKIEVSIDFHGKFINADISKNASFLLIF